ncbi:MAG TPA: preprotein translocase subunit SecE [Candidatus Hydrogenedentes bacterium]|nr:preprotein translocase subunit SecE [Candidatus Hydrogenedentota bacterium]HOH52263.1 preprotein translocase subunit SecE [Candidatus Hydrogenedentota bacterium]HPA41192.1 preprotein translocase subunit SecE [Candidatus Hydrogenedentota bacterium]HQL95264.1 preprotein translocase subunit SecE [Candidatus Hydrogenedentota bacterium]HRZ17596.1 preprotein translocase subunit SecE [Candidatus Hydrogenedentota bacterium]
MAKQLAVSEEKPGLFTRIRDFYEDVMSELRKVTWPTRDDLKASTKVTLFLVLVMAVIVFLYDTVLGGFIMGLLRLAG